MGIGSLVQIGPLGLPLSKIDGPRIPGKGGNDGQFNQICEDEETADGDIQAYSTAQLARHPMSLRVMRIHRSMVCGLIANGVLRIPK